MKEGFICHSTDQNHAVKAKRFSGHIITELYPKTKSLQIIELLAFESRAMSSFFDLASDCKFPLANTQTVR